MSGDSGCGRVCRVPVPLDVLGTLKSVDVLSRCCDIVLGLRGQWSYGSDVHRPLLVESVSVGWRGSLSCGPGEPRPGGRVLSWDRGSLVLGPGDPCPGGGGRDNLVFGAGGASSWGGTSS